MVSILVSSRSLSTSLFRQDKNFYLGEDVRFNLYVDNLVMYLE
jgi:hypothetical protein